MRKLPTKVRVRLLSMLCEGTAMRAVAALNGVSTNTVAKLLADAGAVCSEMHDELVRNIKASRIQCDEVWTFRNREPARARPVDMQSPKGASDTWTWTGIDADSKLIVGYLVGDRSGNAAIELIDTIRECLAHDVELNLDEDTTTLDRAQGNVEQINYGAIAKFYGPSVGTGGAESIDEPVSADAAEATAIAELPTNLPDGGSAKALAWPRHLRQIGGLPGGLTQRVVYHTHMVALYVLFHNFIRAHPKLGVTPAIAAGILDRPLSFEDVLARVDEKQKPGKRGPYKKRAV